jgi:pyruvate oxidase
VAIKPDSASLRAALELVGSARQPVILVGLDALWDKTSASVTALAEHLDAPVLTTAKCKGVVSEDHSLRAGFIIGGIGRSLSSVSKSADYSGTRWPKDLARMVSSSTTSRPSRQP